MSSLYKRGNVWWVKSYRNGKMVRTSLKTTDKVEARRRMRGMETQTAQVGRLTGSKVTWDTAAADLLAHYRAYGTRNPLEAGYKLKRLTEHFHGQRLGDIDAQTIAGYVVKRKTEGMANGTINIELMTLGRALRLAREQGKLDRVPVIRTLRPASPRSGFFEADQFEAVSRALPDDLALAAKIGYTYGWRVANEVRTLTKAQLDLYEGALRLSPGKTKNRDGRVFHLTSELKAGFVGQLSRVKALQREIDSIVPWLFPHLGRGRHQGTRIKSIRRRWATACKKVGLPGMLVYDLRRTACRNLVHAGVPERVVMAIMGHRTRGMFNRDHIVSPQDLREASRKLSGLMDKTTYNLGTGDG